MARGNVMGDEPPAGRSEVEPEVSLFFLHHADKMLHPQHHLSGRYSKESIGIRAHFLSSQV